MGLGPNISQEPPPGGEQSVHSDGVWETNFKELLFFV